MAKANVPLLAFNRGIIDSKALARVDLDRTRLSAEVMTNWLPKTQGSMRIRPGTKHLGNSLNDTGAQWIEFVASTDDIALLELTDEKMRVWLPSDTGNTWETPVSTGLDVLMARPKVDTTLSISDTGWDNASTGGSLSLSQFGDEIPTMTSPTTDGVTISAGDDSPGARAWQAADDDSSTNWNTASADTGRWWWKVDFGAGNEKKIKTHSLRAPQGSTGLDNMPTAWSLQGNDVDTGDGWTTEVSVSDETGWAVSERREFEDTGFTDTGANSWRFWRIQATETGGDDLAVAEIEMFEADPPAQADFDAQGLTLNATAIGSLAKATKRVIVDTGDLNEEHSLAINVTRGPVTFRCGSSAGDEDYISETILGTGNHNLAFTPATNFHVTVQSGALVDRIVRSLDIGDSGTVEITAPWTANDLDNIRYDQSADVVYVDADGVKQHKIERRGTGRSWSVVEYNPTNGPFRSFASSTANLSVSRTYGNTTLSSDVPFFRVGHKGALIRLFHNGQSGEWPLGALDAVTDPIEVTGITDTGTDGANRERRVVVSVAGTYNGTVTVQKSVDGEEIGFHDTDFSDTGTATHTFDDPDDNVTVWFRAKMTGYTSGVAVVNITYKNGGVNGIGRITAFNSNKDADIEVLSRFSDTGGTDSWQEGAWSGVRGFPSAVALHEGRLAHAGGANIWLSVSDDFENFDDETEGESAPIIRTLGSGPVDNIHYLVSLLRLIAGTSGAEIAIRSSSLDEVLTPENSSAKKFSTQGSFGLRALPVDSEAVFVQRSGQRVFTVSFAENLAAFGSYGVSELTMLVPELLKAGIVSIAVQRQPDTRIHCVLADGTVGILTYEPREDVLCWSKWETDGSVERAMVLPGVAEDAVYYHVNRTINGSTKRFLEKWALESESDGDTGLSFIMDCSASNTDTGRVTTASTWTHLEGESVVAWGDDTGQTNAGRDLSPDDTGGDPTLYTVSGGAIDISSAYAPGVHHLVAGLPYTADWRSAKLAYAAEFGTALAQLKRVAQMGMVLSQTHNNALLFGSDTGHLDPLPRVIDEGARVDADKIFTSFDQKTIPFDGTYDADSRVHIRARAPRPATVLALVPSVKTSEKA